MILNGLKKSTTSAAPESHNYVFYFDEKKANLCKVIRMEEVAMDRDHVFLRHGNVQHAGNGYRGKYKLRYHVYLNPEDVDFNKAVAWA